MRRIIRRLAVTSLIASVLYIILGTAAAHAGHGTLEAIRVCVDGTTVVSPAVNVKLDEHPGEYAVDVIDNVTGNVIVNHHPVAAYPSETLVNLPDRQLKPGGSTTIDVHLQFYEVDHGQDIVSGGPKDPVGNPLTVTAIDGCAPDETTTTFVYSTPEIQGYGDCGFFYLQNEGTVEAHNVGWVLDNPSDGPPFSGTYQPGQFEVIPLEVGQKITILHPDNADWTYAGPESYVGKDCVPGTPSTTTPTPTTGPVSSSTLPATGSGATIGTAALGALVLGAGALTTVLVRRRTA